MGEAKCPKCSAPGLMTESLGGGKVKKNCRSCGFTEVIDDSGRQLLTDDMDRGATQQAHQSRGYLVEG